MIYDAHIHLNDRSGSAAGLKRAMAAAGIGGGAIFSLPPEENNMSEPFTFEERLGQVLDWCAGEEHFYPVLFIHPDEPEACDRAREAVRRGIAGFKMICNTYAVGDDRAMALLQCIAGLGKPVFFHSGILWNYEDSSKYNRPASWEALITLRGLRFSLAHCAWPWLDECLALYGKFLYGVAQVENAPEMFFDLTPGTPEIYRRELLFKLFNIGYDVEHNIISGYDCSANSYNADWPARWLGIDGAIYDELGISQAVRRKINADNFLRFIGKAGAQPEIAHTAPTVDGTQATID